MAFASVFAVLAVDLVLVVVAWGTTPWPPTWLFATLFVLAVVTELGSVRMSPGLYFSDSFLFLLAMALLGPVPAAAMGVGVMVIDGLASRKSAKRVLNNVSSWATYLLAGGLAFHAVDASGGSLLVAALVIGLLTSILNFGVLAALLRLYPGDSITAAWRHLYLPTLPHDLVSVTLGAAAIYVEATAGTGPMFAIVAVVLLLDVVLRPVAVAQAKSDEVIALTQQRASLLADALSAEEAERAWLAEHLHDETLQLLALSEQDLADAAAGDHAALERAQEGLAGVTVGLRRTLSHFHPVSVDGQRLGPALEAIASQLCRGAEQHVDVTDDLGGVESGLVYAIARELIANAARHAGASRIDVVVRRAASGVMLEVSDDGHGFLAPLDDEPGHLGLAVARRRAEAAGGVLSIDSAPGAGTRVEVVLPTPDRRPC